MNAKLFNPDLTPSERTDFTYAMLAMMEFGGAFDFFSAFISYAHEDQVFARALHDELQGRGVRCWLDKRQMLPGDDIYDSVDRAIRTRDKLLLICSQASLTSEWVEDEIDTALEMEQQLRKEQGKRVDNIIPVDLDGYLLDGWESSRAVRIRRRLAANFPGWRAPGEGEAPGA